MIRSSASVKHVHQFKIELLDISPPIWRRIQVPESYTFWALHVAIQDAMGWQDYHLHEFRVKRKHAHRITRIGLPDDEEFEDDTETEIGWTIRFEQVFWSEVGSVFEYEYDFGDGWVHDVTHEGILVREPEVSYPRCIGGERACPPEDCGGPPGYADLVQILADPNNEEYTRMRTWAGGAHDPEQFDPLTVKFDNPQIRLRKAFR